MNFTPSSTGLPSPPSAIAGVPRSNSMFCGMTAADCADSVEPMALTALTVKR